MAILETIIFTGKHEALTSMVEAMRSSGALTRIRGEKGCICFDFYFSADEDTRLLLLEKWESAQALELHHGTEMMAELLKLIKDNSLEFQGEKYEI